MRRNAAQWIQYLILFAHEKNFVSKKKANRTHVLVSRIQSIYKEKKPVKK